MRLVVCQWECLDGKLGEDLVGDGIGLPENWTTEIIARGACDASLTLHAEQVANIIDTREKWNTLALSAAEGAHQSAWTPTHSF